MNESILRTILGGVVLGLGLAITLALQSSAAILCPDVDDPLAIVSCSERYLLLHGERSPVGIDEGEEEYTNRIYRPRVSLFGELVYEDFVEIEKEAFKLLDANKKFRRDISPHNDKPRFDQLVRQFDYNSGFSTVDPDTGMTLQKHFDQADSQLRRARDLYAYLAVYADSDRFRKDTRNVPDYQAECDPALEDVVANTIDRCNFIFRMRESLREAAYLRMIFGQQFTADAMGLHFDAGEIIGGEAFVRDEVRKLELAVKQYKLAEEAVSEGMSIALGSGCFVSDFYSDAEWALISRAVEGMERAQHHIAVRKSYLDDQGRAPAEATYRDAAATQFVQLVGLGGLTARPLAQRCQRGTRPDNDVVAEMVANLLDTRQGARNLLEGRNVFGFDTRFTPARPYLTAPGSPDTGIYDAALAQARLAKEWQNDEVAASREFDRKQSELQSAIRDVKDRYDGRLRELTACSRNEFGSDSEFFACIDTTVPKLIQCDVTEYDDPEKGQKMFDACIASVPRAALLRQTWENLRAAHLRINRIKKSFTNVTLLSGKRKEMR